MDDLISRQAAIDIERNATVDTNPSHFEAHQKFTQFMDDAEISSFGRWQWSNGFNTALTAVGIDLKKLPSAQLEQRWIPCSEKLPKEEKKTYWVCTDTEYQCECRWTNNRFGLGEGEWGWSIFDTPQYSKPIAWMPLPKVYEGRIEG